MKFNVIEPFVYPSCLTERQKFPFIKQLVKNTLRQTRNHPKFKDRDTCKTIAHINDMNEGHYRVTIVFVTRGEEYTSHQFQTKRMVEYACNHFKPPVMVELD